MTSSPKRQPKDLKQYEMFGKQLICSHCGNDTFYLRERLLNTGGMTLMGLDWANKAGGTFTCGRCGKIEWFEDVPELGNSDAG